MKKKVISIISVLLLSLSVVTTALAASTSVTISPSQTTVRSSQIWINGGDTIMYNFSSNSSSVHSIGFGVYYQGTLISSSVKVVSPGGYTGNSFTAPAAGYYSLGASCGGTGQTGCSGSGSMDNNW